MKRYSILPGFKLTLGFSIAYAGLLVLIPLAGLFLFAASMGWSEIWTKAFEPRSVAAFSLSLFASLIAAILNTVFGFMVAWVIVRYSFAGKRFFDALIDLPFALPTAVSGIALTTLFSGKGWIGQWLEPLGIQVAFTRLGIVVVLVFVGLPFAVRTVQPAIEELSCELEEAAAILGAGRWQTFRRVIFPSLMPATLTGFALAFARGLGEYGSVVFIAGNMPMRTEIVPLLIITKLEQFDYGSAAVLGTAMLILSFVLLLAINLLQRWGRRYAKGGSPG